MVEAGMKPMESIISATVTPAKLLKVYDQYGSISEGKIADIIAVSDDPTENINTMESVNFVMKKGKVYKNL
jgi:imidazolonepropionase-like amidohydrolase